MAAHDHPALRRRRLRRHELRRPDPHPLPVRGVRPRRQAALGGGRPLAARNSRQLRKSLGKGAGKLALHRRPMPATRPRCASCARAPGSSSRPSARTRLYGEPLVRVCAETGTDYCDLTGEVQWMRRMIHEYENAAQASGARIVHNCGFDSIPSDLGVHFLQQQAQAAVRPALHHREDARPLDARRFLRRHRRLAAERAEGSHGESGVAQGTRRPLFDLPAGQRQARPAGRT